MSRLVALGSYHARGTPGPAHRRVRGAGRQGGRIAVSIGARVSALARAGEVLVSQTVKDLVAGSEITFADRGVQQLKGVPGEWRLYSVAAA